MEVEAKTTSEAVVNGAVASEEATEATAVEAMKEPELDEEEKERRRMQEEEQRRQDEIVSNNMISVLIFISSLIIAKFTRATFMSCRLLSKSSLTR